MASRYDELYFYIDVVSLHRDSRNDTLKIIYLRDVYPRLAFQFIAIPFQFHVSR